MESDLYYGCWAEYRLQYLKSEKPELYQGMKEQGTFDAHLRGIEETYEEKAKRLKKTNAIDAQVKEILRQEICQ